jgi:hypothetical protein
MTSYVVTYIIKLCNYAIALKKEVLPKFAQAVNTIALFEQDSRYNR